MLIGGKDKFAIETECNNFYYDEWIGEGYFIVYIDGCPYGIRDTYATLLYCIYYDMEELQNKEFLNLDTLADYSDASIAEVFYDMHCREKHRKDIKDYEKLEHLIRNQRIDWPNPECAFDDGSFVLQLREHDYVRLIGFQTDGHYNLRNIHSVKISEEYYQSVIAGAKRVLDDFKKKK